MAKNKAKKGTKAAKKSMSFIEVLESEYKYLVEAIEHGSSDPEVIEAYKKDLFEKTGYKYE